MRYAIIEDGIVANIAVAAAALGQNWIAAPEGVGIGWAFDGTEWTRPPEPSPEPVETVSAMQARIALRRAGLLAQVEAAVAQGDDELQDAWEYAIEWKRSSPTIAAIGTALGLSEAQIDDLFRAAAEIEA